MVNLSAGNPDGDKWLMRLSDAKSPGTIKFYAIILRNFFRNIPKDPKTVTLDDLYKYNSILSATITKNIQIIYLNTIKQFIADMGSISESDLKKVQPPRGERRIPAYLSEPESARLLKAAECDPRNYAIISTFLYLGVRISELLNLNISDINFNENTVLIRHGKGAKDRLIPLPQHAKPAILNYLQYRIQNNLMPRDGSSGDALFLGRGGKRLKDDTIRTLLIRYSAKAGIKRVYPHMLRHSCLTALYRKTRDIVFVSKMAGHAHVGITSLYANMSVQDLQDVYSKGNLDYNANTPEPVYKRIDSQNTIPGYG